jgi:hypothetical protein
MAKEKKFETKIKEYLHSIGIYAAGTPKDKMTVKQVGWFFKHWAGPYSPSGIPDIIACVNGKFVGIEVKAEDGHPSALQTRNIELIEKSNGIGLIIYPKDFEMLKSLLKAVSEGKEKEFYKLG